MRGWLKTFRKYKFLASLNFYFKTLRLTAHLAFEMQKSQALITDIKDAMKETLDNLEELESLAVDLPFEAEERDGTAFITPTATNLPASQKFKDDLSQKERAKAAKCLTIHREEFIVTNVHQGKQAVRRIKENLLPNIQKCIKDRFSTFSDPIFEAMCIIDCFRWDYDDSNYGVKEIKLLSEHFSEPLSQHKFKLDSAIFEFREVKKLVKSRYRQLSHSSMVWDAIFKHHNVKFGHILLLAELIIVMEWASSTVERGFSTVNRMLTNSRLRLSKERLNNLLLLRINVPVLTTLDPNYEAKLVDKTVDLYLNKQKRYHSTKSNSSTSEPLSSSATEKEDLFLPTPLHLVDHTPASMLLEDDSHLRFSDSDLQDDQSDDYDSDDNSSADDSTMCEIFD